MRQVLRVLTVVAIVGLFFQFGCKDKSVDPPIKNPRDYTWRADTIAYPTNPNFLQVMMSTLWGTAPDNVYVTGGTSSGAIMFRYDGSAWTRVFFPDPPTFGQSRYDNSQLLGFGLNNIYVVGGEWYWNPSPPPNYLDSSSVLHFDGSQWRQIRLPDRSGNIARIWASSSNNIYIGGRDAIWHFDGILWRKHVIPITDAGKKQGVNGLTGNQSGTAFVSYTTHENAFARTRHYFLSFRSGVWTKLDTMVVEPGNIQRKWGYANFWTSPSGTMYSVSSHVFVWNGTSWTSILETTTSLAKISGTSDSNIFVTGPFGTLWHYNGTDWYKFKNLEDFNIVYVGVWTDGKEAFICGATNDGSKSILLHGK